MTATLDILGVRRLALARAGCLPSCWSGLPGSARGSGETARAAAHAVVERFGYLQLDTISVAGARSHALVLLSRLRGVDASLGEQLLVPGAPLFEGIGHEACWMPLDLYPAFAFRRARYRAHPEWGPYGAGRRGQAIELLARARAEGPFRSADLEGHVGTGFWRGKEAKRTAEALWRSGDLAVRERRNFQRVYDLPERVIPADVLRREVGAADAFRSLILRALDGHGWAEARTIAATWRLRPTSAEFRTALQSLAAAGAVVPCALRDGAATIPGWIRPRDLELAARLRRVRPRADRGVLLSPFDPLLWDRARVRRLFGFDVVLEIYVPPSRRRYGYFCMPVLAGERLVARVDLKAERGSRQMSVVACVFEPGRGSGTDREAVRSAVERHAEGVGLEVGGRIPEV